MYNPAAFRETRPEAMERLIAAYPLAALVTVGSQGIEASHIPLLYRRGERGTAIVRGHLARENPQWRNHTPGSEALAIFSGPQHYISPGWYPSKREHGKVVPTWNYLTVHAHGPLTFIDDREWLLELVSALTDSQEKPNPAPWRVSDAPREFIDSMLASIVGVELRVTRLEGKWKLSQNRPVADREGVIAGLEDLNSPQSREMAELVKSTLGS
jgi:transcriptional regulator